MNYAVMIVSEQ
jgi:hypothetical protein